MTSREKALALGCSDEAIAEMARALKRRDMSLSVVESIPEMAREVSAGHPIVIILGVRSSSVANLETIDVIHAVRERIPVIVVAEEDSLDLERKARERGVFYYLVEPLDAAEIEAVIEDTLRYSRH